MLPRSAEIAEIRVVREFPLAISTNHGVNLPSAGSAFPALSCRYGSSPSKVSDSGSISRQVTNRPDNIRRLGQNGVLKRRVVGAECIGRRHASHRSVEVAKQFVGDARRDFSAIAPRTRVLVRTNDTR